MYWVLKLLYKKENGSKTLIDVFHHLSDDSFVFIKKYLSRIVSFLVTLQKIIFFVWLEDTTRSGWPVFVFLFVLETGVPNVRHHSLSGTSTCLLLPLKSFIVFLLFVTFFYLLLSTRNLFLFSSGKNSLLNYCRYYSSFVGTPINPVSYKVLLSSRVRFWVPVQDFCLTSDYTNLVSLPLLLNDLYLSLSFRPLFYSGSKSKIQGLRCYLVNSPSYYTRFKYKFIE